jgi:hypothetical protein
MLNFGSEITNSGDLDRLPSEQRKLGKTAVLVKRLLWWRAACLGQRLPQDRLPAFLSVLVMSVLNLFAWFLIIGFGWLLQRF